MEKYLRNYAEPEVNALESLPDGEAWTNVLVIPACNEAPRFLRPPPPCPGRSLIILVINETAAATASVSAANQFLAGTVQDDFEPLWQSPSGPGTGFGLELLSDPHQSRDILLVDRYSKGRQLPPGGGVGHARKIGADLAAELIHGHRVSSSWIHCSDADVHLPQTYFDCSRVKHGPVANISALVYPYRHRILEDFPDQDEVSLATRMYECSLRYYVAGLKYAGSPYAFHTIGSTMAVNALHYAKVRGFPRREAAEDFYLLNKLAKVGEIVEIEESADCEALVIEARRSDRVPFGTGAAIDVITRLNDPMQEFRFYHPGVFEALKTWLESWPSIWQSRCSDFASILSILSHGASESGEGRQALIEGLTSFNTGKALEHAFRQSGNQTQFTRQMHTWFDAFRTLKLIHFLRENALPSISYGKLGVMIPDRFPVKWDVRSASP